MPIPNFHTCAVRDSEQVDIESIRTVDSDIGGKPVKITVGRVKGQTTTVALSFRYPTSSWSADQAAGHCGDSGGRFEAAEPLPGGDDSTGPGTPGTESVGEDFGTQHFSKRFTGGEVAVETEIRGATRTPIIRGYAAVFYDGTPATEFQLADDLVERIMPTAFDTALDGRDDGVALFNHNKDNVLGRQSAGTLQLLKDDRGLRYQIRPPDTTVARDLVENLKHRNVTGSSFSFQPRGNGRKFTKDKARGLDVIELTNIETFDVGPVTFPAYKASLSEVASARACHQAARRGGLLGRLMGYRLRAMLLDER